MDKKNMRGLLGFTGSRTGLTGSQHEALDTLVTIEGDTWDVDIGQHGDCVGGDAKFHGIIRFRKPEWRIFIHPPNAERYRAFCEGDVEFVELPYLQRNMNLAKTSSILIGCPKTDEEVLRSGTWATIRNARKLGVPVIIIKPSGEIVREY